MDNRRNSASAFTTQPNKISAATKIPILIPLLLDRVALSPKLAEALGTSCYAIQAAIDSITKTDVRVVGHFENFSPLIERDKTSLKFQNVPLPIDVSEDSKRKEREDGSPLSLHRSKQVNQKGCSVAYSLSEALMRPQESSSTDVPVAPPAPTKRASTKRSAKRQVAA